MNHVRVILLKELETNFFQMQAMTNIEVLNSFEIKTIVTTCPHCFNTLKNEYPDLGEL